MRRRVAPSAALLAAAALLCSAPARAQVFDDFDATGCPVGGCEHPPPVPEPECVGCREQPPALQPPKATGGCANTHPEPVRDAAGRLTTGRIVVRYVVQSDGGVDPIERVDGPEPLFESVRRWLLECRFEPAREGRRPLAVRIVQGFNFRAVQAQSRPAAGVPPPPPAPTPAGAEGKK